MRIEAADLERICDEARLSDGQRAILRLRLVEGLTDGYIAELLGIKLVTVRTRLNRARRRIRKLHAGHAPVEYQEIAAATGGEPPPASNSLSDVEYARVLWSMITRPDCNPPTPVYDCDSVQWARPVGIRAQRVTFDDVLHVVRCRREAREDRDRDRQAACGEDSRTLT